jgi:UDP-N-acetylmuramoylalanine--D-glutamate ligase
MDFMDSSSTSCSIGAGGGSQFRGKKITLMGLGLLGRGLGDARFLAAAGADLIITDLKTEAELAPSIAALADVRGPDGAPASIVYHLGEHRREDFEGRDFILRAPNAPLDSPFLARARSHGVPVEMDASLFVKLCREKFSGAGASVHGSAGARGVTIVGITGTRGKSTTTHLIYEMVRAAFASGASTDVPRRGVYLGGNERDTATLPLIEKVVAGDIVILELDSWQLQGFDEGRVSPAVAVWTNFMPDHMNYYHGDMDRYFADKAAIVRFQRAGSDDLFIAPREIKERVESKFFAGGALPGNWVAPADLSDIADWEIALPGEHNRANAACAVAAARALGVSDEIIKKVLKTFTGLPGRLELLGEKNGVAYYNDSNSTTPDATIAALRALVGSSSPKTAGRPIVLIAGGNDKELDFAALARELADMHVKKSLKAVVLFEGKASEKLKALLPVDFPAPTMAATMPAAFEAARALAAPGDIILLSPGATSFGIFKNEYDRGDQFGKAFEDL